MYLRYIPIFESSDENVTLPDGLLEAFENYIKEAEEEQAQTDNQNDQESEGTESKITKARKSVIKYGNPKDDDIIKAIKERKYVGIYYEEKKDHDLVLKGFRLIEPICFGKGSRSKRKDKKTGKYGYFVNNTDRKYLRAFVIRDTALDIDTKKQFRTRRKSVSKTKKVPYFRLFRVDRIQSWFTFDFVFSKYRTLYNPKDECMVDIIASLNYDQFPRGEKASY